MKKIALECEKIKKSGKMGLMTHVVVGYPSLLETKNLVMAMAKNGANFVELQIPFSDPIADGPTILKASQAALDNGTKVSDAFFLAEELRKAGVGIPFLFMTYSNIVVAYGIENFFSDAKKSGIDGFILPDLPFETPEGKLAFSEAEKNEVEIIPLFAPTMSVERMQEMAKYTKNLLYAVSRTGVTGTHGFDAHLDEYLENIKKYTKKSNASIALGFGIQSKDQVDGLLGKAEIAVIGSHLVRIFEEKGVNGVEKFLQDFS